MTTNSVQGKWDLAEEEEEYAEEEEEEEALSLCDLPVTTINHNDQPRKQEHPDHVNETQEEFDFRGLFSKELEMCVADEVFFQGQILPFRHSFSSEAGLLKSHGDNRCRSKSESLGHGYRSSISEFRSNSSRSSSVRSQNSSSSTSSTATTIATARIPKPRFANQFHTHPSPKPQLKSSGPRQASFGRKSSVWEIFRIGVVPAPEIALQDLKVRSTNKNCVSRNSSNSSSNSDKLSNKTAASHHGDKSNHFFKHLVGKGGGFLLSGCDCSIETVVQCDSDMAMIKGGTKGTSKKESATATHAAKEKVIIELKKQRKKQGKKVMSRRRTFEWLKELHASHVDDNDDEEALLSKG